MELKPKSGRERRVARTGKLNLRTLKKVQLMALLRGKDTVMGVGEPSGAVIKAWGPTPAVLTCVSPVLIVDQRGAFLISMI